MQRPIRGNPEQVLQSFDAAFKKRALRDAVVCIACMKLISIICYTMLFFTIHYNSSGKMSLILQIMVMVFIPLQILNGILLLLGSLEDSIFQHRYKRYNCTMVNIPIITAILTHHRKILALDISLWLCLILASFNTVLGVMGSVYFIRTGYVTVHFVLALIFTLLAMSLFSVICHDILVVYAYKQILLSPHLLDPQEI